MKIPHDWIVPEWPVPRRVRALITTRSGGSSEGRYASLNLGSRCGDDPLAVTRNRGTLRNHLPSHPVWLTQVHGTRVVEAAQPGTQADAAVAREAGCVCAVLSADCLPVLLADDGGSVVAIAHAGWRGLAAGVIENAVRAMRVPAESVLAYLGPGIGPAAYEVGREVVGAFVAAEPAGAQAFRPRPGGKFLADLYLLARQRLHGIGVTRIHGGSLCTYSDSTRFFSYRRDGVTGRTASMIWLE